MPLRRLTTDGIYMSITGSGIAMLAKQSRPVAIVITQILMAISLVPIALGLVFSFVRALIANPSNLVTVRSLLFLVISSSLMIVFLVYGFGGLWKRKRSGYWIGLLFLAIGIAASAYRLIPSLFRLLTSSNELTYQTLGYGSSTLMIVDLGVQGMMLLLLCGLFLKLLAGTNEKAFFSGTP